MTLFAGALLRTIEFVMVTTDASFPGPGERGRGGSRELGSRADDARRRRRGLGPAHVRSPGTLCTPQLAEDRPRCQVAWDRGGWSTQLSPWTAVRNWDGKMLLAG